MSRMLPRFAQGRKAAKSSAAALTILSFCAHEYRGPRKAEAAEWSVDPQKSEVSFEASGSGYSAKGDFKVYKAEIEFDPDTAGANLDPRQPRHE